MTEKKLESHHKILQILPPSGNSGEYRVFIEDPNGDYPITTAKGVMVYATIYYLRYVDLPEIEQKRAAQAYKKKLRKK